MSEPKKRHTSTRSGNRRSHLALKAAGLQNCPKCKAKIIPHRVCKNCGYYKGRDVLQIDAKTKEKKERRKKREEESEK